MKVLHKNNIEVDQKKFVRRYSLNEKYFDDINTNNKAYILGLLFADGHNELSKGTITISLEETDKYILEAINNELQSDRPLEYIDYSEKHDFGYNYHNQYRLNICSMHMCKVLERLGMTHNKSYNLKFPEIPHIYYKDFIRGYYDGNGTINKYSGSFSIVSTLYFATKVREILSSELQLSHGLIRESQCKNGITYDLHFHRQIESHKIFSWLYHEAVLFLSRKKDKFDNMKYSLIA